MPDVMIIGDGPGGLSAALFLAKRDKEVLIFGQDKTAMHAALLLNYLGIESMTGSEFQALARKQAASFGAKLRDERVAKVVAADGGYTVTTEGGESISAKVLVLSEGKGAPLARSLGLEVGDNGGIEVDANGLTKLDGLYVIGRSARPGRSQAIISAGDGAAAALDILSREAGENVCDWDVPPKD